MAAHSTFQNGTALSLSVFEMSRLHMRTFSPCFQSLDGL